MLAVAVNTTWSVLNTGLEGAAMDAFFIFRRSLGMAVSAGCFDVFPVNFGIGIIGRQEVMGTMAFSAGGGIQIAFGDCLGMGALEIAVCRIGY